MESKYNQFLLNIETALKQIEEGKARCYIGKYDGKKGKIEIILKKKKKITIKKN